MITNQLVTEIDRVRRLIEDIRETGDRWVAYQYSLEVMRAQKALRGGDAIEMLEAVEKLQKIKPETQK